MEKEKFVQMARALKSMSHPHRLQILLLLGCKGKMNVTEIRKEVRLTQPMASQHLLGMKTQGILSSIKEANKVYYLIRNKNVIKIINCMKKCKE